MWGIEGEIIVDLRHFRVAELADLIALEDRGQEDQAEIYFSK